jgi:hypothetical protein
LDVGKRRKPRAEAATKKNRRILIAVKAIKHFGQVSIPGG